MTDLTGNVHRQVDAQSTPAVDVYAAMTATQQLQLRGAFLTLWEYYNTRIQTAYKAGDYPTEYALCDVATAISSAFYRCGPAPVIP